MCCKTLRERHGSNCDCTACNEMYGLRVTEESRRLEKKRGDRIVREAWERRMAEEGRDD